MRLRYDPRLILDRVGQVEFELGGYSQLVDGTARHHKHEFHPYQWRDPSRARDWARLPPDLIELMKAEDVDALPIRHPIIVRKPAMAPEPTDPRWEIQYADSDVLAEVYANHHRASLDLKFTDFVDSKGDLVLSVRTDLIRSIRAAK